MRTGLHGEDLLLKRHISNLKVVWREKRKWRLLKVKRGLQEIIGGLLVICFLNGCAHQEYGILPGPEHLEYETTGFRALKTNRACLLVRPVNDTRFKYVGTPIAEKKAMLIDSAFRRDMAAEFEISLLRELRESGLFREVLLTEKSAAPDDYVLDVDLQIFFSELKGFMGVLLTFSAVRFDAILKKNNAVVFDKMFEGTGREGEKKSKGFGFATHIGSMDEVLCIALRKTMQNLLQDITESV